MTRFYKQFPVQKTVVDTRNSEQGVHERVKMDDEVVGLKAPSLLCFAAVAKPLYDDATTSLPGRESQRRQPVPDEREAGKGRNASEGRGEHGRVREGYPAE